MHRVHLQAASLLKKISTGMLLGEVWLKSSTRTLRPGTRDLPQSLKVGPGTPLKFKVGTQDPLQNLKVGPQDSL